MNWSAEDLRLEWLVIYQTRLGILCGDGKAGLGAQYMATEEADEAVAKLRELNEAEIESPLESKV